MAKVKVEVTGAYVDGSAPGSTIEIDKKSAKHLEAIGYVRKVTEKAAPKKPAKKATK